MSGNVKRAREILTSFPGPVTVEQPRYVRMIGGGFGVVLLVAFVLLVVVGVPGYPEFDRGSRVFIGLWFLCPPAAIALVLAVRFSLHPPTLMLEPEGFGIIDGRDVRNFRWEKVENFRVGRHRRRTRAVFTHIETRRGGVEHRETASFEDTYGMSCKTFCQMMEIWRAGALGEISVG